MDTPHLRLEETGEVFPLGDDVTTVGRGGGVDISLDDPSVSRLHAEIVKGMSSPAGRERLNQLAFDPVLSTPDQYAAHIKSEVAKWAQVAKTAGAKLD